MSAVRACEHVLCIELEAAQRLGIAVCPACSRERRGAREAARSIVTHATNPPHLSSVAPVPRRTPPVSVWYRSLMKVSSEAPWFRAWPSCGEIARGFPLMNIGEQREKSSTRALSAPELGRAPDHLALSLGPVGCRWSCSPRRRVRRRGARMTTTTWRTLPPCAPRRSGS